LREEKRKGIFQLLQKKKRGREGEKRIDAKRYSQAETLAHERIKVFYFGVLHPLGGGKIGGGKTDRRKKEGQKILNPASGRSKIGAKKRDQRFEHEWSTKKAKNNTSRQGGGNGGGLGKKKERYENRGTKKKKRRGGGVNTTERGETKRKKWYRP